MLKKAGIVVAAAAAGLLAVSPLAFAGDKDDHGDHDRDRGHSKTEVEDVNHIDNSSEGLINVAGNNLAVPVNVCDNQVPVNVLGVQVPLNDTSVVAELTGALGLLGDAEAESDGDNTLEDNCEADAEAGDDVGIDD